jgi:hypothetical protein
VSDPGDPDHAGDFVLVRNPIQDDQDDGGIPLSDWQALISTDTTLEPLEAMFGRNPATGARVRIPLAGGVKWMGHPVGVSMPFSWSNGQILCYNLDQITLVKVRELATLLRADCIETPW